MKTLISIAIGILLFIYGLEHGCGFLVIGCVFVGLGIVLYDSGGPTKI